MALSYRTIKISIHAPREGSDILYLLMGFSFLDISIHAPREGSDAVAGNQVQHRGQNFYPRSPRGERPTRPGAAGLSKRDFYPRSPRGERPLPAGYLRAGFDYFYPRSPRGERPLLRITDVSPFAFLSTLPARGATYDETHREE